MKSSPGLIYVTSPRIAENNYNYVCDPNGKEKDCCDEQCSDTGECIGTIPESITNLNNLQYLYLNNNYHLSGPIPDKIGDLSSLSVLDLRENQLETARYSQPMCWIYT